jgi:hypothetical protein
MCISWWFLNTSHLKMHGRYNVKYTITISMCGIDNIYRLKLYRIQIKIKCFQTYEMDKALRDCWVEGPVYREAVCTKNEHSVQYRVDIVIYLQRNLPFTADEVKF